MVYDPSKDRSPKSNQQTPFQSRRAAVVVPSDTLQAKSVVGTSYS